MPQQNIKEIISVLTHSLKCQNDVSHDNINMDASPTGIYIGIRLYCKTKLRYPCSMESFSKWETIVTKIEKQIKSQSSFNKDSWGPKSKVQNF